MFALSDGGGVDRSRSIHSLDWLALFYFLKLWLVCTHVLYGESAVGLLVVVRGFVKQCGVEAALTVWSERNI